MKKLKAILRIHSPFNFRIVKTKKIFRNSACQPSVDFGTAFRTEYISVSYRLATGRTTVTVKFKAAYRTESFIRLN